MIYAIDTVSRSQVSETMQRKHHSKTIASSMVLAETNERNHTVEILLKCWVYVLAIDRRGNSVGKRPPQEINII